jgi:hypothetical protein
MARQPLPVTLPESATALHVARRIFHTHGQPITDKKQFPARGNCAGLLGLDRGLQRHVGCFRWNRDLVHPLSVDYGVAGAPRRPESARRHAIAFQARTSMGHVAWAVDGIVAPPAGRDRADGEADEGLRRKTA